MDPDLCTVREIARAISELGWEDLAEFRRWFLEFDAAAWDRQFEDDVAAGRLNALADEALSSLRDGGGQPRTRDGLREGGR